MTSEWPKLTWGELVSLEYGKALRDYRAKQGRYPVYGTNGPIGFHDTFLSANPGIIIGRKGAYRGVHYSSSPFFVIDTAFFVKPKVHIDMKWAYYALLTQDINNMDSGSAIPSTSREEFYKLPVALPSFTEQVSVSNFLSLLDKRITLLRETNKTLEFIAQTIFKSWFVNFDPVRAKMEGRQPESMDEETAALFPDTFEESELGLIPAGWYKSTVGESFILTMGQSPPGESYNPQGDGMPFYQGRTDFGFRFPTQRVFCDAPKRIAEPDDTLVSVRAPVGDVNLAFERCCIGRGIASVRHPKGWNSFTYYAVMNLRIFLKAFDTEGTVFGSINKTDFERLPTLFPSIEVQQAYENIVSPLNERIRVNEQLIRSLTKLRDNLLPRLISGQLRMPGFPKFEECTALSK